MKQTHVFGETIFALSSGRLPSGVAVVRISGPQTRFVIETICGNLPEARYAALRTFKDTQASAIDRGLVLFFPAPHSFTGEDCGEFHLHGGKAVVDAMLSALYAFEDCRMAEAGEFTRRAFANGKFDLTVAEGLADLIAAETDSQRRLALQISSGAQAQLYASWRTELIRARALIEAELDFADEADVPGSVSDQVWHSMRDLAERIRKHVADGKRGVIIRDGFRVVIVGAPNAGKSSLLNALAGSDVAIVSDEPGTTRDLIEIKLDLAGLPVLVTDTAGLRETEGKVEKIGIGRALERASSADLVLALIDLSDPIAPALNDIETGAMLKVGTKSDLAPAPAAADYDLTISTRSGTGLADLLKVLAYRAELAAGNLSDPLPTRRRHLELLVETSNEVDTAIQEVRAPLEVRAEFLRRASHSLGRITGDVDVEDILDVVFSQFCIGK
ncbi:tRNA uridine-5-carboxymethylaminomethyl(34) synthesis GTPase MnmE [Phyllobacterium zundukense]|uniref:tRNA modification GTPase MnmE n=1 Tax=Phyllobacterium zundukense TaxID=1867719 RepID=A0A2N9VWK1_9HYPH|nr:tRNA uridine-5-carboxymethylaminomethyl(34) synthesis GTPase MnmE [Phyllobacterium zundukense]ATU93443.1 tRNA uridine-5-carboxymethylaminomethyl(34) synthesis GTPase MnmE [Phyllobacterium zundukense]PIO43869.1 tRNA uridine-5-carboxymethylaminomethyl(34) synthesis GTPase MnmE [Phyllobacterium zundukense]